LAVFEGLTERLQSVFRKLRGQGRITESVLGDALREIRVALLEADVHVGVVRQLLDRVREQALGQEVLRSLSPGQQVIKIVRDELERVLGPAEPARLRLASRPPTVVLLVGLQGSGKTTSAAKLGVWLKGSGHYPYLIPADVQRPAAIEQLARLAGSCGLRVLEHDGRGSPLDVVRSGLDHARRLGFDVVVIDTAGRLHVDEALMEELRTLKQETAPGEILFVADAMTGQDAVRSAGEFHAALGLTGVVLTKLDGDARGGAALSIRHVTGVPVRFVGTGEKPSDFEPFHPDRMTGRILGMGDVLSLIEKAEEAVDRAQAAEIATRLRRDRLTLEDFRQQLRMVRKMGPLSGLVSLLPGMGAVREADLDPEALTRAVAIIDSMTPRERAHPEILNGSRKRRVARGSGQSVQEINRLLRQFAQIRRWMKSLREVAGRGGGRRRGGFPFWGA
jgi:signal recognition particle subunit SRP54